MFGLFLTAAVLNFVMIFISPLAVSSRPPQSIKAVAANGGQLVGNPPHRRRTFVLFRSLPMLLISFLTALITIVASAVATVMWYIFANVFENASDEINIQAHVGTQMMAFMWIGSGFSLIAFIVQFGSCCASCCGGRKARKQLKAQGINYKEKGSLKNSHSDSPTEHFHMAEDREMAEPHAVTRD
jgi:magnesium-transporting ATPase (P-type)